MYIKNPNDIVELIVSDYKTVFGDHLLSVVLYGSALSHEYVPGKSDVNIIIVLDDSSIAIIKKCHVIQQQWLKRGVAIPLFMTLPYISSSLDSYPIEFLNIQSNHRVLFGRDVFRECKINKNNLRLQCERELKGIAIHLRTEYLRVSGSNKRYKQLLTFSMKRLIPIFRAIIILHNRKLPNAKSEVVATIEDLFGLGASELSASISGRNIKDVEKLFDGFVKTIDRMIQYIDTLSEPADQNR